MFGRGGEKRYLLGYRVPVLITQDPLFLSRFLQNWVHPLRRLWVLKDDAAGLARSRMTPEGTGLSEGTSGGGRGTAVSCAPDSGQRSEKQEEAECRAPASCRTTRLSLCPRCTGADGLSHT